ncbi:uncharacterized protein LOC135683022 [Rhopilema esculentum]|uniref:uncharacterized protein LOC135683022 n=1 Tax=Rhopilema esculentum TaxID=499914 RepID=UPI0031E02604|eukprot:gene16096-7449_t
MDNKDPITPGILKQMMEIQDRAYRSSLQLFMNDVKSEIKDPRKDLNDVVKSISFLSNDNDSIKVEMKANAAAVTNLAQKVDRFEHYVNEGFEDITDHTEYLENQSRRNNLKILGVPESPDEKSWDETEKKVKALVKSKLGVSDDFEIERAHHVGRFQKNEKGHRWINDTNQKPKPRPIVAKLRSWKTKEMIVKKERQVKPKGIVFFNDLSQRTLMKSKGQVNDLIKARKRGKDSFFVLDRLIIKDKPPDVNISHSSNEGNAAEAVVSDNEITFKD